MYFCVFVFIKLMSMKLKFCYVLALCAMFIFPVSAQQKYSFCDRLFYGGNFGLSIGTYTDIEVSPHVGYYLTARWAVGIGFTYEYYNNRDHFILYDPFTGNVQTERFETNIWGGRLFTNYVIVNNVNDWIPLGLDFRIFAHVEYEAMSYEKKFFNYEATGRQIQHGILLGGGLRFPMGKRSSMNLTVLWNLNSQRNDFYGNGPILRLGYNF